MKDLKEKISERLKIIDNKKAGETTPAAIITKKVAATSSDANQQQQQPRAQLPPPPQTTKSYASTTKSPPIQRAPVSPFASGRKRCLVCSAGHAPFECNYMRSLSVDARVDALRAKNLCYKCFGSGHRQFECAVKPVCGDCHKVGHQTLLCGRSFPPRTNPQPQRTNQRPQAAAVAVTAAAATTTTASTTPATRNTIPPLLGATSNDA